MKLGEYIRVNRKKLGITQSHLAVQARIHPTRLCVIEKGRADAEALSFSSVLIILDCLRIPMNKLMAEVDFDDLGGD